MSDHPAPIKLEITLEPWQAEAIERWQIPAELCGQSLPEKVAWLIDDCACGMVTAENERRRFRLYRSFGLTHPRDHGDEDDEVSL